MNRKLKLLLIILAVVFTPLIIIVQIGLWKSNGGLIDFIQGQFEPSPHLRPGVPLPKPGPTRVLKVSIQGNTALRNTAPEFLSFALDTSQLVGGKWWNPSAKKVEFGTGTKHAPVFDWRRKKFEVLAKALRPAYLRVGGSEADKTHYRLDTNPGERPRPPKGMKSVMTKQQWDEMTAFIRRTGIKLAFTLNAGPAARDAAGAWDSKNARELLEYAAKRKDPVAVWELANELNIIWFDHGPAAQIPPEQFVKDAAKARSLVKKYFPGSAFTGQSSAYWPILGEPVKFFFSYNPVYLPGAGGFLDHINWHYYPQQSRRGPIAVRRAFPSRLLNPKHLNEIIHWAEEIRAYRDKYAPGKPIWLGESGNAQFGGEPGVSDVYIGGLWWLDQLGTLAIHHHDVVVRHTIVGMNYGLLDMGTLEPRPDYWASWLWKNLMGTRVLRVEKSGGNEGENRKLRVYAHCTNKGAAGSVTMLVINLDHERPGRIQVNVSMADARIFAARAPDVLGKKLRVNKRLMKLSEGPRLPDIDAIAAKPADGKIEIAPLGYTFVVFPKAGATACR